jgi:hypothetical protein
VGQVYLGHPSTAQGVQDAVTIVYDGLLHITAGLLCLVPQDNIRLAVRLWMMPLRAVDGPALKWIEGGEHP